MTPETPRDLASLQEKVTSMIDVVKNLESVLVEIKSMLFEVKIELKRAIEQSVRPVNGNRDPEIFVDAKKVPLLKELYDCPTRSKVFKLMLYKMDKISKGKDQTRLRHLALSESSLQELESIIKNTHNHPESYIHFPRAALVIASLFIEMKEPLTIAGLATMTGYDYNTVYTTITQVRQMFKEGSDFLLSKNTTEEMYLTKKTE